MVPVQTGSETVSGNMGMPRPGTKQSGVFGKIPDRDRDRGVWSGSDRVPIGLGPNFPNTSGDGLDGGTWACMESCRAIIRWETASWNSASVVSGASGRMLSRHDLKSSQNVPQSTDLKLCVASLLMCGSGRSTTVSIRTWSAPSALVLQNTLSGQVQFLVTLASRVGISFGRVITLLWSATPAAGQQPVVQPG